MAEGVTVCQSKMGQMLTLSTHVLLAGKMISEKKRCKYCQECREHLCTTCARCHSRQKATRSHKLVNSDEAKKGYLVVMTTKCRYHPDRDIEMYCGTHDMVYCLKCIATVHRTCSGVIGIEETKASSSQQMEVQLQNDARQAQERLADADKKTRTNIDCLEEQRGDILTKIVETERRLIEHIRKLKQEATDALNKDYTKIKDELKSNVTLIASMKNQTESAINQLQTLATLDMGPQFVQIKLIQKSVADAVKLVENSGSNSNKALRFTENTYLNTSVTTSLSLGQVSTVAENIQTVPILNKVKPQKEVNVKLQNEDSICYITDVCQLQDGTIILADSNNHKIKRLHMSYTIKDHCDLGNYLTGICCTGQKEVAVKMYNNKVQFISVGSSLSKLRYISVAGGNYCGITYCAGKLWISTGSGINVYNTSGTLLKTISKDANSLNLFKSTTQHIAVSGETVIVSDSSDGAVCLGREGTVRRELRDSRLVNTRGVCVSSDGTMFLSGYNSNNMVMFDKNGKCLGECVAKDAGLVSPVSLHYDNNIHCIIATCYGSNDITIFGFSN